MPKKIISQLYSTNVPKFCPSETQIGFSFAWRMKNITQRPLRWVGTIVSSALFGGDAWSIQHVVLFYSRTESYVMFVYVFAMHFRKLAIKYWGIVRKSLKKKYRKFRNHWNPQISISPSSSIYGCNSYTLDCLSFAHKKLNEYRSLIKKKKKKKTFKNDKS